MTGKLIKELKNGSRFVFQLDSVRPRNEYYFNKCDGKYAEVFESKAHAEINRNCAFVSCNTVVIGVDDERN